MHEKEKGEHQKSVQGADGIRGCEDRKAERESEKREGKLVSLQEKLDKL